MKKLKSSSLNTKEIDTPPSKMKILLPYIVVTIVVLHIVLFYVYYNKSTQSANIKDSANTATPAELGYNQYKNIKNNSASTNTSEKVVTLEKQQAFKPVPALMTKSTTEKKIDVDTGKQSQGKNTKTLAQLLGLDSKDLIDNNEGYAITQNSDSGKDSSDNNAEDTTAEPKQKAQVQGNEDDFDDDFDQNEQQTSEVAPKKQDAIEQKAQKQETTKTKKTNKKVVQTIVPRTDDDFDDDFDDTFGDDIAFDDPLDQDIPPSTVNTTTKSQKKTKKTVTSKQKKTAKKGKVKANSKQPKTPKEGKVKANGKQQDTSKKGKVKANNKQPKTPQKVKVKANNKQTTKNTTAKANSRPMNKPVNTKQSATPQQEQARQQELKDSGLLSVDLPRKQQRPSYTTPEINDIKANKEELQDTLSTSIADIKKINRQKFEQERQMAKRAYDERQEQLATE